MVPDPSWAKREADIKTARIKLAIIDIFFFIIVILIF